MISVMEAVYLREGKSTISWTLVKTLRSSSRLRRYIWGLLLTDIKTVWNPVLIMTITIAAPEISDCPHRNPLVARQTSPITNSNKTAVSQTPKSSIRSSPSKTKLWMRFQYNWQKSKQLGSLIWCSEKTITYFSSDLVLLMLKRIMIYSSLAMVPSKVSPILRYRQMDARCPIGTASFNSHYRLLWF